MEIVIESVSFLFVCAYPQPNPYKKRGLSPPKGMRTTNLPRARVLGEGDLSAAHPQAPPSLMPTCRWRWGEQCLRNHAPLKNLHGLGRIRFLGSVRATDR